MADLEHELTTAARIAREAGAILMEIYATDFEVAYKGEANPVTDADMKANAFITKALRDAFPDDGVVAEETADQSDALKGGRCWFVDPLDGTKEFIKKNGEFAVMLGLSIDGEAKLGVVFQPAKDKLYGGVVGSGAWLEEDGKRRALTVSGTAVPSDLRLVTSRSHRSESIDRFVGALGITNEHQSGSVGLKIGLIAEQIADVYIQVTNKSAAWDACGPEAILHAAGGRLTKLDGTPYRYDRADVSNDGGILACNAAAFDAAVPAARDVGESAGLV
ncbi:MAG: 3'(2'),5'-bisphosphate nucleotidase CysQ [Myxococcota bacterium]